VRLLLDEMISLVVAEGLRDRGHDVVAVQEHPHLRGIDDCLLLDHAVEHRRALVTDNVPDLLRCHQARLDRGRTHFGLLLFGNDTFPRPRHELFVSHLLTSLDAELATSDHDDGSGWVRWLHRPG
jgi:hypothetical protein